MILLTGATGQVGGEVARQLAAGGHRFRALVRNRAKAQPLIDLGAELAEGDLADSATVISALGGVDRALLISGADPNWVQVQTSFIQATQRAGLPYLVKISAIGAKAGTPAHLLAGHAKIDEMIHDSDLSWTILQPNFFMQNLLTMAGTIKQGAIYQPAANSKASFIDVVDVAAVAVEALTHSGRERQTYVLTGPQSLGYEDLAATAARVTGKPVAYIDITPQAARQAMLQVGLPPWLADGINELSAEMRLGHMAEVTDAVERILRRPGRTFEQFAQDHAAAFA